MTAANIQNALVKRIEETLEGFPLKTEYNNPTPFQVFKHKLPENKFDYSKEGTHDALYPFCVVKINNGFKEENQGMQETVIDLIIGVKNTGQEGQGYDDVMACIEAIWHDFNNNPYLDKKYPFKYPLNWALDEEDRHPFYFGGMQLTFESHSITDQRQGGFLHGQ